VLTHSFRFSHPSPPLRRRRFRKLVVTVVATVVQESHLQILVALIVLFAAAMIQALVAPYETDWLNA